MLLVNGPWIQDEVTGLILHTGCWITTCVFLTVRLVYVCAPSGTCNDKLVTPLKFSGVSISKGCYLQVQHGWKASSGYSCCGQYD